MSARAKSSFLSSLTQKLKMLFRGGGRGIDHQHDEAPLCTPLPINKVECLFIASCVVLYLLTCFFVAYVYSIASCVVLYLLMCTPLPHVRLIDSGWRLEVSKREGTMDWEGSVDRTRAQN